MFSKLNKAKFIAYLNERGAVGNQSSPAIAWFASNLVGRVMELSEGWLSDGKGFMLRVPEWAKNLPARCTIEDVK